jgi:hypothetical protein
LHSILSTYNVERLQEQGITHVISLIDRPLPSWLRTKYKDERIQHIEFRIQDDELEDILGILREVCDMIQENVSTSGVLVHCGLGISRSGTAVVGYCEYQESPLRINIILCYIEVMRSQRICRDKASSLVQSKRPRVQPIAGFWKQLEIWESLKYEIWEESTVNKREKAEYRVWKGKAVVKMNEMVGSFKFQPKAQ